MPGLDSNWEKKVAEKQGWGNLIRRPAPVKPQIERANKDIAVLISKLAQAEARIRSRDEVIFKRVVSAVQSGDNEHAAVYANELSEVRKLGTNVKTAKLALEQVSLRLTTITDMGDLAATLAPTVAVVRGVGQGLGNLLPSAQGQIEEIGSLLSSTLVEVGTTSGTSLNFNAASDEAEKVLEEASAVAYRRMEAELPAVPSSGQGNREEDEALTA